MDGLVTINAPAKLNLALSVAPPEPAGSAKPGWHRIASLMATLDWGDEVTVFRLDHDPQSAPWELVWDEQSPRRSDTDWPMESDLAWRAIQAVRELAGPNLQAGAPELGVRVLKRVPAGGGLGGGSSDAAAAAFAAAGLLGITLDQAARSALADQLGSDTLFFLEAQAGTSPFTSAFVGGFGEVVEPTPLGVSPGVTLFFPRFECATPGIYKAYDSSPNPLDVGRVRDLVRTTSVPELDAALFNDLTDAAVRANPDLGAVIRECEQITGSRIHMSGSGSTLFSIGGFTNGQDADPDGSLRAQCREAGLEVLHARIRGVRVLP